MKFDKETMTRNYLFITNRPEIKDKLAELERDNCFLLKGDIPSEKELKDIAAENKWGNYCLMYFESFEQHKEFERNTPKERIGRRDVLSNVVMLPFEEIEEYKDTDGVGGDPLTTIIELPRFLEIIEQMVDNLDNYAERRGWILHSDFKGRCGNCHALLEDDDKYCTLCGTKRGEGEFRPYSNIIETLYGCPLLMKWKCPKCGHTWVARSYTRDRYCKECGALGKLIKEEDGGDFFEMIKMTPEEAEEQLKRFAEDD